MKEYVLFSPIGMSDPTSIGYDGPFLHILRQYKPSKVYIFLTEETKSIDNEDNRYELMAKKLLPNCEVIKLDYSHIIEAHNFLIYDKPFEIEIKKIKEENPDYEILVNITSGTPQMEATLYLLSAVLPFNITGVQVSTPQNSSNKEHKKQAYNIEYEWKNLMDNESDSDIVNRCIPVVPENVRKRIMIENIIILIKNYDYNGALQLLNTAEDLFEEEFIHFLKAAAYRISLNIKKSEQELRHTKIPKGNVFTIETSGIIEVYEYILYLQIKANKNELSDFSRGISPVITDLFQMYLEKQFKIRINNWCKDINDVPYLSGSKLPKDLLDFIEKYYNNSYRDSALAASNLLPIIEFYHLDNNNDEPKKVATKLREFEENVRNIAAHEIVGITEDFLRERTDMTIEQVLKLLIKMFGFTFQITKEGLWDSYENMNNKLIGYLK